MPRPFAHGNQTGLCYDATQAYFELFVQIGRRHPALAGCRRLGGFGPHEPFERVGRIQHLHILSLLQGDGFFAGHDGVVVGRRHVDVEHLRAQGSPITFHDTKGVSHMAESHLSPGVSFIGLRRGVSHEGGGTGATVVRRSRRGLGVVVTVCTWYAQ